MVVQQSSPLKHDDLKYKVRYLKARRQTDMTFILGARCSDGVVLVGDRRITSDTGTDVDYEDKLFKIFAPLIVGSSGAQALFDKFKTRIETYVNQTEDISLWGTIEEIETTTREINRKYGEVLSSAIFDVLIGLKVKNAPSVLQYVSPSGLAESVRRYKVIGHGEPYGSALMKRMWQPEMTMEEVAELGYFVIKYIEKYELDNSVGVGNHKPQIWFIPDTPRGTKGNDAEKYSAYEANMEFLNKAGDNTKLRLERYDIALVNSYSRMP